MHTFCFAGSIFPLSFSAARNTRPNRFLRIPHWVDYELYNRRDIEAALGNRSWVISQKDASIRNFGFLVGAQGRICGPQSTQERKRRRRHLSTVSCADPRAEPT